MWKMCGIMSERITGFEVRIWKKGDIMAKEDKLKALDAALGQIAS